MGDHSRSASPAASTSRALLDPPSLLPPAPRRTSSTYRSPPSLGVSSLTTRSSSTSRLHPPEQPGQRWPTTASSNWTSTSRSGPPGAHDAAYRAWRRDSKEHALLLARRRRSSAGTEVDAKENWAGRPRERKGSKGKGKEKAVAFVVGLPSSGEEGDVEHEEGAEERYARREDGLEGVFFNVFDGRWEGAVPREPSPEDIIRAQKRKPTQKVDSLDLDSLLSGGIGDYTFVTEPSPVSSTTSSPRGPPDKADGRRRDRVLLGKGKFSEVLLVRKGGTEYAMKHTPLHPHHPLIASRLLREPDILAQLLPHRNLVKVFEAVRTPGNFYLIEENLRSSVTLEALVSSSPGGVLSVEQAWSVMEQLCSVVRSLHEPLRVCHRDIKPENVLIRVTPAAPSSPNSPPTLLLKLLDFGLATHFSSSEPKLTTCCGSPAYHSPELWLSLRNQHSPVHYWGPEIDIWCTGLTVLRCLAPSKYPLGVSHTSLQALSDKVVDVLLSIRDPNIRQVLAGFLHMDGKKRMKAFERFCAGMEKREKELAERSGKKVERKEEEVPPRPREFKSTSFLPSPVSHRLKLFLDESSAARCEGQVLETEVIPAEEDANWGEALLKSAATSTARGRSTSTTRTATLDSPKLSPTTVIATGLPRAAFESPEVLQKAVSSTDESSAPPSPAFSPLPGALSLYPSSSDSLASPYSLLSPSAESLSFRHPTYPPPIELTVLNPTEEPIRRAVSYIKYALRCSGILYHVRSSSTPRRSNSLAPSFTSPDSAPPSLPPTPYIQPFPSLPGTPSSAYPFPLSSSASAIEGEGEEETTTYLECVVALPAANTGAGSASNALLAALQSGSSGTARRPGMPPRAYSLSALAGGAGNGRSASTPSGPTPPAGVSSGAGRKDGQKKKEEVEALTFFLSIKKVSASSSSSSPPPQASSPFFFRTGSATATPSSPFPSPGVRRQRRGSASPPSSYPSSPNHTSSSRIIITLSDDRALPFVRNALAIPPGSSLFGTDSAEDSSTSASSSMKKHEKRGRQRVGGVPRPLGQKDGSGSREARRRREERSKAVEKEENEKEKPAGGGRPPLHGRSFSVDPRALRRCQEEETGGGRGRRSTSTSTSVVARGLRMDMGVLSSSSSTERPRQGRERERTTSLLWEMTGGLVSRVLGGGGAGGGGEKGGEGA
ncbi:hypothetical protein JCM8547_007659 [Rhodosporidiobolus lusitaniae]